MDLSLTNFSKNSPLLRRGSMSQNLLQSQFGKNIQKIAKRFGEAIKSENDKDVIYYDEIWEICKSALEFMYEERFDFIYSDDYYGIYMINKDKWLYKIENNIEELRK